MNINGVIGMLLSLSINGVNNKHLLASMMGDGSVVVIGLFVVLAIIAGVVLFLKKRKKDSKGEGEDE